MEARDKKNSISMVWDLITIILEWCTQKAIFLKSCQIKTQTKRLHNL